MGKPISRSTVWRILDTAALKPWRYEHWIFPRDPQFAEKAGVVLDLYAGLWQGEQLTAAVSPVIERMKGGLPNLLPG